MSPANEITSLLSQLHSGQTEAASALIPLIHGHLRRIAAARFARERKGHTLSRTDLVHETYLRLLRPDAGPWKSRHHFFRVASRAMREILIDYARSRAAGKRGGGWTRVDFDHAMVFASQEPQALLSLDDALHHLARLSRRQSRIVELRFFGGLTVQETAAVLHISATAVKDDWALAKAWLQRELRSRC